MQCCTDDAVFCIFLFSYLGPDMPPEAIVPSGKPGRGALIDAHIIVSVDS